MKVTNYAEAIRFLEGFIGKIIFKVDKEFLKKHDPLERMRVLLNLLGNPQSKFKSVLIGGTSGKGSTAYLISHILETAGYKTGLTISPHLEKVNERLQINGKEISDERFVKLLKSLILPSIRQMSKMEVGAPSYFEILVGMAFTYFVDQKVDIAVVEVGMGGEFDATNTLNPLIAVLTNVGLDHTNILGKTVEKIAKTKAGIIKRIKDKGLINNSSLIINHLRVVTGVRQPSVIKIVKERCEKVGVELNLLWRDFGYKIKKENIKGSIFDLTIDSDRIQKLNDLQLSLIGRYQVENASLAVKTVSELRKFGFKISNTAIRKALLSAFFPGRFELIERRITRNSVVPRNQRGIQRSSANIILDGAHNPTKMRAFLSTLKKLFPKERPPSPRLRGARKIFIVGFKFDKEIKKMLKEILQVADAIIVTQFKAKTDTNIHASADAIDIKNQILKIKKDTKVAVEKDSKKALDRALAIQQFSNLPRRKAGSTIIVVTGSLYLVGEIRSML